MHVLAYFVETDDGPLAEELIRLRDDRRKRNLALAQLLASLGIPVTYEMAVERAGSEAGVGRPHFAAAMVAVGAADSIDDAFDRVLGNDRPGYVPKARLSGKRRRLVDHRLGRRGGARPPLQPRFRRVPARRSGRRAQRERVRGDRDDLRSLLEAPAPQLKNLAKRFDLVATGGSDYHGESKPDLAVGTGTGDLKVADRTLTELGGAPSAPWQWRPAHGID